MSNLYWETFSTTSRKEAFSSLRSLKCFEWLMMELTWDRYRSLNFGCKNLYMVVSPSYLETFLSYMIRACNSPTLCLDASKMPYLYPCIEPALTSTILMAVLDIKCWKGPFPYGIK